MNSWVFMGVHGCSWVFMGVHVCSCVVFAFSLDFILFFFDFFSWAKIRNPGCFLVNNIRAGSSQLAHAPMVVDRFLL